MKTELMRVHRTLCSPFVDEELFRHSLGGTRGDLSSITRYLSIPVPRRPALSWFFDRDFYVASNADVREQGLDPLLHFIESGFAGFRAPSPLVDLNWIMSEDPHVLGDPPDMRALMDLLEYDLAPSSPYFDLAHYRVQAGVPAHGLLRHFLTTGLHAGTRLNAFFDPAWYATRYEDVPKDPYGALRHFIVLGDLEGRAAGPAFDGALYRRRYPDVVDGRMPPLRHYLLFGRAEGRQAASDRPAPADLPVATSSAPVGQALPVDPIAVVATYEGLRVRLAALRQDRKDAFKAEPPSLVVCPDPKAAIAALSFPMHAAPRVSVLIPVFNEAGVTAECLTAIAESLPLTPFEIIVVDDRSTDSALERLADVPGLVHVRLAENKGFLRACNEGFARCRGEYVLLLNNDTQPLAGAIDRLAMVLDADVTVGAAGAKLIYPDGRLQEAGCFLRPNGESGMIGLFGDPAEPSFNYDRDVAYCSGAALMVRRSAIGSVLFDEAFLPAYCEDADLCLRLLAGGHRVRYVHDAVVVHHLSVSTNRGSQARKLRGIARNQQTLAERWGPALRRMDAVRTIAFHLPQFHPTPENELWWGAGFTEWTNVAKARPSYAGHYQPHLPADLGFYDLRLAETLARQAALAARYGIEAFCVYYYNFGSRRVLSQPMDVVRASPDIPFRYCLCWANENWTRHWDGGSREILLEQSYDSATLESIVADGVAHAKDSRYIRVNGRPLFLVYRPLLLPDPVAFAEMARWEFTAAGFPGVHLVYVESMEAVDRGVRPADLGFDACVEFPPHGRAVPAQDSVEVVKEGWSGYRYDYEATALGFIERGSVPYSRYPCVFPAWDNTPRQPMSGTSFDRASPEAFRFYVEEKIEEIRNLLIGDERLLFVNAWNEWAEGAHLEPDTGYGHRWLEALRDATSAKCWA